MAVLGTRSRRSHNVSRRARGGEMFEDLMNEAAKLRAEIDNMTKEDSSRRADQRRKVFESFDLNKNGTIERDELEQGLKNQGLDIDGELAAKLLKEHDKNNDGVLQFEEFDDKDLAASLLRLKNEARDQEFAARKQEMEKQRVEKENFQRIAGGLDVSDSLLTRAVSTLPYLLPFLTVLPFGGGIGEFFQDNVPDFAALFVPLFEFAILWNRLIVMRFVIFLGLLLGSEQEQFPLILRLNMRSAAILDTAVGFALSFWLIIATFFLGGPMPLDGPIASFLFLGTMGIIGLSTVTSLFGQLS